LPFAFSIYLLAGNFLIFRLAAYLGTFRSNKYIELQGIIYKTKHNETPKNAKIIKKRGHISLLPAFFSPCSNADRP